MFRQKVFIRANVNPIKTTVYDVHQSYNQLEGILLGQMSNIIEKYFGYFDSNHSHFVNICSSGSIFVESSLGTEGVVCCCSVWMVPIRLKDESWPDDFQADHRCGGFWLLLRFRGLRFELTRIRLWLAFTQLPVHRFTRSYLIHTKAWPKYHCQM